MLRISYLVVLSIAMGCIAQNTRIMDQVDKLNRSMASYDKYISENELDDYFRNSILLCKNSENNDLSALLEKMREQAFITDNFHDIDETVRKINPVINAIIGGEANYISPNLDYFLSKSIPDSSAHRFFTLARNGWYDPAGNLHGGSEIFPAWIIRTSSVTGTTDQQIKKEYAVKWNQILPELHGTMREVGLKTLENLQKE